MSQATAIRNVCIFDGERILQRGTVVFQDGVITAVGDESAIPSGAQVIDGEGQTLLPGLIDAHTHVWGEALKQALIFGVTTELDMFMDQNLARQIKEQQAAGGGLDMADLRSAGTAVTAPGGHCTEYGIPIPTITAPEEAQDFVDARIAEGSDYIKVICEDGKITGHPFPTISRETLAAVIAAAHKRGKLAVVHITTYQDARAAIAAGADALAHLFVDEFPDADFGQFVAGHHAFVIPTLTVLESLCGTPSGASLSTDARLTPYFEPWDGSQLQGAFPRRAGAQVQPNYAVAQEAVRQLKAAGVPILAGTDAPNPGTQHGVSIHRELELLVQAGLMPLEALAAATSLPAAKFGLHDRGRIAVGLRADLLLVSGDPVSDITATRAIAGVWKRGVAADREGYRAAIERRRSEARSQPAPAGSESGLVSDFEDGTMSTAFGAGWQILDDSQRGGSSRAEFRVVTEGAGGGKGSLLISGEIGAPSWFTMAGAIFFPGAAPWTPANLSAKKGLTFWTKGDGKPYRVMLFVAGWQSMPPAVVFVPGQEWQQVSLDFSQFSGVDGSNLLGVLFAAGMAGGPFAFQIDDVRFI